MIGEGDRVAHVKMSRCNSGVCASFVICNAHCDPVKDVKVAKAYMDGVDRRTLTMSSSKMGLRAQAIRRETTGNWIMGYKKACPSSPGPHFTARQSAPLKQTPFERLMLENRSVDKQILKRQFSTTNDIGHTSSLPIVLEKLDLIIIYKESITSHSSTSSSYNTGPPTMSVMYAEIKLAAPTTNVISAALFGDLAPIEMYSKCGIIDEAFQLFDGMTNKDVISWSTMVNGFANHSRAHEEITFMGVLSACVHDGLLIEAMGNIDAMTVDYYLKPGIEHYGCIVDLLARLGHFNEAIDFIGKMPLAPDAAIWGSILGASRTYRNGETAILAPENLIELEPGDSGNHILLAITDAASGKWDEMSRIRKRKLMRSRGMKKIPGCSLIEINNVVHEFDVGNTDKRVELHTPTVNPFVSSGYIGTSANQEGNNGPSSTLPSIFSSRPFFTLTNVSLTSSAHGESEIRNGEGKGKLASPFTFPTSTISLQKGNCQYGRFPLSSGTDFVSAGKQYLASSSSPSAS